jgi:hypothetical protein
MLNKRATLMCCNDELMFSRERCDGKTQTSVSRYLPGASEVWAIPLYTGGNRQQQSSETHPSTYNAVYFFRF